MQSLIEQNVRHLGLGDLICYFMVLLSSVRLIHVSILVLVFLCCGHMDPFSPALVSPL